MFFPNENKWNYGFYELYAIFMLKRINTILLVIIIM